MNRARCRHVTHRWRAPRFVHEVQRRTHRRRRRPRAHRHHQRVAAAAAAFVTAFAQLHRAGAVRRGRPGPRGDRRRRLYAPSVRCAAVPPRGYRAARLLRHREVDVRRAAVLNRSARAAVAVAVAIAIGDLRRRSRHARERGIQPLLWRQQPRERHGMEGWIEVYNRKQSKRGMRRREESERNRKKQKEMGWPAGESIGRRLERSSKPRSDACAMNSVHSTVCWW